MIVNGKAIAEDIFSVVKKTIEDLDFSPKLGVITCSPGPETRQYLELKQRKARSVGVDLVVLELPNDATTEDCVASVSRLAESCHGVLVQLPLPQHINREAVLDAVPVNQDPDGFAYGRDERAVLPPVVGAIKHIAQKHDVTFANKKVVIVGHGRLVGKPAAVYAETQGAEICVLEENSTNYTEALSTADIIISGVGKSHFITRDMVKEGVVVFDAGASEDGGQVVGDVHPDVAKKASLFTPVPGGIGPITVAVLLNNLVSLITK